MNTTSLNLKKVGVIDFFVTQQGEQHFRITDIIDITGENIAVENNEIGVFAMGSGSP